jgi:hypothetical protein
MALVALEDLNQQVAGPAVGVTGVTVLPSVIAHSATADPLSRVYGPRIAWPRVLMTWGQP